MRLGMAKEKSASRQGVDPRKLEGFKLLRPMSDLLKALRTEGKKDRNLEFDHYVSLLLFYFFNPTLTSLRGLQASTEFPKVQKKLGIPRSSLGSLSAAQHVFDHKFLEPVLEALLEQLPANRGPASLMDLGKTVTAVDGTLLKALPRVAWALWVGPENRAAKAHVQFEILKGGCPLAWTSLLEREREGCLSAESQNGVALQFYAALIASLLISLWLGRKPTRRTFEAICFYLQGWASEEDVLASVRRLKPHT